MEHSDQDLNDTKQHKPTDSEDWKREGLGCGAIDNFSVDTPQEPRSQSHLVNATSGFQVLVAGSADDSNGR